MDVLVLWEDGTKNVVISKELKYKGKLKKGIEVRMTYDNIIYHGKIIAIEEDTTCSDSDLNSIEDVPLAGLQKTPFKHCTAEHEIYCSDDDLPLIRFVKPKSKQIHLVVNEPGADPIKHSNEIYSSEDDLPLSTFAQPSSKKIYRNVNNPDADPNFTRICEAPECDQEIFSSCHKCWKLLCYEHFLADDVNCQTHCEAFPQKSASTPVLNNYIIEADNNNTQASQKTLKTLDPEVYTVEGSAREGNHEKVKRVNKQKVAKASRNSGQEYVSVKTKKTVPAKFIKARCNTENCKKLGRLCYSITDEHRKEIFESYYTLSDIHKQREFLVRHIKCSGVKQKTTKCTSSRRGRTFHYYLSVNGECVLVCKLFFLNSLGINDRIVRTAFKKISTVGIIEGENRGGRQSKKIIDRDAKIRFEIAKHIDRFPKVESHYCRAKTTKEYLHHDLTVPKMHDMFLKTLTSNDYKPSLSTYQRVFREKNLSFHKPKKDLCSLCTTYKEGSVITKSELEDRYQKHLQQKSEVRKLKEESKSTAANDKTFLCASFDLQQVIYLPQCNENAIFYKRRLANFNSIMATMLLYAVARSTNIDEISLRYFESFHGQNEGDSAHSAISYAIKRSGNLFIPSQLYPVFQLARRQHPYIVHSLRHDEFLDFKELSKRLRVLTVKFSDSGEAVKWTEIMDLKVQKQNPNQILYKTSHLQNYYKVLSLKRQKNYIRDLTLLRLNSEPNKISGEKFVDLCSLCRGQTPLIKLLEHQDFYNQLPHL